MHSSDGPVTTPNPTFTVTCTFDTAVTGVTVNDFNSGVAFPTEAGVTYALSGSGTEWVLTVSVNEAVRVDKAFSFAMVDNSGSISPPNDSTGAPLELT